MTAPAVDQSGVTSHTGGPSATITISAAANTVIVLAVQSDVYSQSTVFTNSVSGAGLTWVHLTSQYILNGGGENDYCLTDVWYAVSASAISSQVITVTSTLSNMDAWALAYVSFTGCGATPLDSNASLPVGASQSGSGTVQNTGVSTTNANDTLVFIAGTSFASSFILTPLSGSTVTVHGGTGAGLLWAWLSIITSQVSNPQSSVTFGSSTTETGWCAITFALQGASSGGGSAQLFLGSGAI